MKSKMPNNKKTKKFNIEVDGVWYSESEYENTFGAKEQLDHAMLDWGDETTLDDITQQNIDRDES